MENTGFLVDIRKEDRLVNDRVVIALNKIGEYKTKYPFFTKDIVQISRIDGCTVKKVGSLNFDFRYGACKSYQFEIEKILIYFGVDDQKCDWLVFSFNKGLQLQT